MRCFSENISFVNVLFFLLPVLGLCEIAYGDQAPLGADRDQGDRATRVAIIGAGPAGASTAYYLRKHVDSSTIPVDITVFERSAGVGGRTTTVNVFDDPSLPVELGASIFVEVNEILMNASKEFDLDITLVDDDCPKEARNTLGIWNGAEFVYTYENSGYYWWDVAKLLWKYGMSPIRTQKLMKSTVGKFLEMYKQPHFPWKSLSTVALNVGLVNSTAATGAEFLKKNGISDTFSQEIIQASTRVNYGQNLPLIHGLETMVCMATDGAHAVKGGNWQIFDSMVRKSRAEMKLNATVSEINRNHNGTYTIHYLSDSEPEQDTFDHVVLATPLQFSDIDINPTLKHTPDVIPYVQLHVTLFSSPHRLSPRFFNLPSESSAPRVVLTTLPSDLDLGNKKEGVGPAGFWSVSTLKSVPPPRNNDTDNQDSEPHYVYKIFSPEPVTADFMANLLGIESQHDHLRDNATSGTIADISQKYISWYHKKVWDSYPYLYPRVTFEEVELDTNFWYTSGMESFISTMETSALSGMNAASLVFNRLVKDFGLLSDSWNWEKIEL